MLLVWGASVLSSAPRSSQSPATSQTPHKTVIVSCQTCHTTVSHSSTWTQRSTSERPHSSRSIASQSQSSTPINSHHARDRDLQTSLPRNWTVHSTPHARRCHPRMRKSQSSRFSRSPKSPRPRLPKRSKPRRPHATHHVPMPWDNHKSTASTCPPSGESTPEETLIPSTTSKHGPVCSRMWTKKFNHLSQRTKMILLRSRR